MLSRAWFIVRYWLLWIFFFEACRIIFLIFNYAETSAAGISTAMRSLLYGLRMDMSMAAYFSLPIGLFILASLFFRFFQRPLIYQMFSGLLLLLCCFLVLSDLNLFKAWGYRIDASVLKYMKNPKEMYASISYLPVFWLLLGFLFVWFLVALLFANRISKWLSQIVPAEKRWLALPVLLLMIGTFIIPLRGGLQLAPLNQSSVYFSANNFANQAAINAPWNFMYSLNHNLESATNPFIYMDGKDAELLRHQLYASSPDSTLTPQTVKPNIIIIVWESLTKKVIGLSRDGQPVTPGFDSLRKEGLYFSDIYATGDRTDKGIVGVLSGYPAQPTTSIVKVPSKAAKLPMLSREFRKAGYQTSFYYGGELEFANMKAYLLGGAFNQFISIGDFQKKDLSSKWGAFDDVVMHRLVSDQSRINEPFFTTWLTLSSHEPFETPVPTVIKGSSDEDLFLNSLHYTDSTVFEYVQHCKQQPWWSNTILVIVADHGHRLPATGKRLDDFKIPLLFLGGALPMPAQVIKKTGDQTDIAATLLAMTGRNATAFNWSKNLLDSTSKPWAYFSFNNGFGYATPAGQFIFDNVGKLLVTKEGLVTDVDIRNGKAMQQLTFQDYLQK
ncbi:MAG: sulfatase [Ferruginibacter sp.]|nr:sulfatase [Ferruginibacter sp.]